MTAEEWVLAAAAFFSGLASGPLACLPVRRQRVGIPTQDHVVLGRLPFALFLIALGSL